MPPPREDDVDVVIPVYNGARFLAAAIRSTLEQTLPPRRVIVVDDGSTDDSAQIAQSFAGGPVELIVLRKANAGVSAARNTGIAACRSPFVAFFDADDLWTASKLARQVQRFRTSELLNLGVVFCDYDDVDEGGSQLHGSSSTRLTRGLRGQIKRRLYRGNLVAGSASAVLVRRSCLEQVGGFDESLHSSEDWDLWLRLADRYTFDYVDEVLVHLRRHGTSAQAKLDWQMLHTDLEVLGRQRGNAIDRGIQFTAFVRRLAQTPDPLVRALFASEETRDLGLIAQLSLGLPRPLLRAIVQHAKTLRDARSYYRAQRA